MSPRPHASSSSFHLLLSSSFLPSTDLPGLDEWMRRCRLPSRRLLLLSLLAMVILVVLFHGLLLSSSASTAPRYTRHSKPEQHPTLIQEIQPPISTKGGKKDANGMTDNEARMQFVKEMMLHAWYGYKNNTWGANEIRPIAKTANNPAIFGGSGMAATIVDAADTLWIMGLTKEYEQARDFISTEFTMKKATGTLSVFETVIRFVGGLLSLHALSHEAIYATKAQEVMDALLPAFNTPTGIPKSNMDMKTGVASNYGWANGGSSILAEIGSLHLELIYLTHVTEQPIFARKATRIRDALQKVDKVEGGLYSNYISPTTGKWAGSTHVSLGALGDSFYEYLIKSWLQSGKRDEQARQMYWDASAAIQSKMVASSKSGLRFVGELRGGRLERKMGHLACFATGMFALEAHHETNATRKEETMKLAEDLGSTCHESYVRSETRIGPEMFYFDGSEDATSRHGENGYILRPEVIEGFFYLWRLTHKEMYREWVWDAITAINTHCRVTAGFAGLHNVYSAAGGHDDVQQSFFLAETLKYSFLTFADDSVLSLDEWVFNTEAHPFPVLPPPKEGSQQSFSP